MNSELLDSRPVEILLVEDNEHDVVLTRVGFEKAGVAFNLHHVENGEACLAFLRKQAPYADAPTPDVILLDLNMPLMDGREVMAEIAADADLCHLPVVVLTTSAERQDVLDMYKLRCNSYITKPVDFDQFQRVIVAFSNYWFKTVVLPPH